MIFFRKFLKYCLIIWGISLLPVIIYKWVNPPFTMIQNSQSDIRGEEGRWIDIEEIPKHFQLAAMAGEDQVFLIIGVLISGPLKKPLRTMPKAKQHAVQVPFHSKLQKMFFVGRDEVG